MAILGYKYHKGRFPKNGRISKMQAGTGSYEPGAALIRCGWAFSWACLALLCFPLSAASQSAGTSVSGSVRVLKKNGKSSYDSFAHAVAWLEGGSSPAPQAPRQVNQLDKTFHPRVLPVVRGQVVHFMNQDNIDHNVFSTDANQPFDLGRYPKGDYRPIAFDQAGIRKIYCNIHKAMILDVVVVENEHFATSNDGGSFVIEAVPSGRYTLNIWHIYGGTHSQEIEVADEPIALDTMPMN